MGVMREPRRVYDEWVVIEQLAEEPKRVRLAQALGTEIG
jgi:hypothetical protein